jgi:hypothetical protein
MNMRFFFLACLVTALAVVTPAVAQDPPATLTLSGTVTSSSPTSLVIRADDGSSKTFTVDDRSTLPATLASGARVNVTYEMNGSQMRAVTVAATDAAPPPTAGMETDPGRTDRLPATASPLPLIALLSAVALASGIALRRHLA